ncbi:hypothetical protein C8T65DRAFT_641042 [Cerioporus squamosus]|nr:hypothetical protein C8T65DRAFT_641042 [Cerioporus squamosus]
MDETVRTVGGGDKEGMMQTLQQGPSWEQQQTMMQSTSSASLGAVPTADDDSLGSTPSEKTTGGVQWFPCDLPAWSCRNCQRMLGTHRPPNNAASKAHVRAEVATAVARGASTGGATGGGGPAAGNSVPRHIQIAVDGTKNAPNNSSTRSEAAPGPNTHPAQSHRHMDSMATEHDTAEDHASEDHESSTDDVDSVEDDPDWEETSSTLDAVSTVRHSPIHDDLLASDSSSFDSSDEDYKPYSTQQKRRKGRGRPQRKAVKRSRRG